MKTTVVVGAVREAILVVMCVENAPVNVVLFFECWVAVLGGSVLGGWGSGLKMLCVGLNSVWSCATWDASNAKSSSAPLP